MPSGLCHEVGGEGGVLLVLGGGAAASKKNITKLMSLKMWTESGPRHIAKHRVLEFLDGHFLDFRFFHFLFSFHAVFHFFIFHLLVFRFSFSFLDSCFLWAPSIFHHNIKQVFAISFSRSRSPVIPRLFIHFSFLFFSPFFIFPFLIFYLSHVVFHHFLCFCLTRFCLSCFSDRFSFVFSCFGIFFDHLLETTTAIHCG